MSFFLLTLFFTVRWLAVQVETYRGLQERFAVMQEENRQLYNTVQDLRGNIRVFCRVRPRGATGDGSAGVVEVGAIAAGLLLLPHELSGLFIAAAA